MAVMLTQFSRCKVGASRMRRLTVCHMGHDVWLQGLSVEKVTELIRAAMTPTTERVAALEEENR